MAEPWTEEDLKAIRDNLAESWCQADARWLATVDALRARLAAAKERNSIIDECRLAIRAACTVCGGTGADGRGPQQYVTREMAIDAGQPEREGEPFGPEPSECEYCGRPMAALAALAAASAPPQSGA